ncbi:Uncharacterised protein [Mycobacterium tuberculosis]|nr:Uncharacterised protein [Mycobacterium tuberculosis]COY90264.1 Uncharacterised protein [Mycobacterium tuberculosis]
MPSPAVAPDPSRSPTRWLAQPRTGISSRAMAVSPMPITEVSARCSPARWRMDSATR